MRHVMSVRPSFVMEAISTGCVRQSRVTRTQPSAQKIFEKGWSTRHAYPHNNNNSVKVGLLLVFIFFHSFFVSFTIPYHCELFLTLCKLVEAVLGLMFPLSRHEILNIRITKTLTYSNILSDLFF